MADSLVPSLLPVLSRSLDPEFNVFDVMRHGQHEKQISNVFRWLLDADGTHALGGAFAQIFIEEINSQRNTGEPLPLDGYWVKQEVNTSDPGMIRDIADLVLESRTAVVVVENYFTSDGHDHSYSGYLKHAMREGKEGVVVLLCQEHNSSRQDQGWQDAPVLTYASLIERLNGLVHENPAYRRDHPDAHSFIQQLHRKFVKGKGRVMDSDVLDFVVKMCDTGEARRYQDQNQTAAAEQFASDLSEQARHRFGEGRELMQQVKSRLKEFSAGPLASQLNDTFGEGFVREVNARYAGIYQWTINFETAEDQLASEEARLQHLETAEDQLASEEARLQIKFGASAWHAIERDDNWKLTVSRDVVDYSCLFLTRRQTKEVRPSTVSIQDVIDGLDPEDTRLHNEIVRMIRGE